MGTPSIAALALALVFILPTNAQAVQDLPVNSAPPVEVAWSNRTYGPDGPWHAITVQIGSPPQAVDLFPASPGPPNILSSSYCLNYSLPDCTTSLRYFNSNASRSYDDTWYQDTPAAPDWELPLITPGHFGSATDIFSIPVQNGAALTCNATMRVTTDGQVITGESGFSSYYTLGTLGLGSGTTADTLKDGPYGNYSVNYAYQNASRIPSASFALHVGSVVAGVPPSLHFGGYDRSRVVGTPIDAVFNGDDAIIGLRDISIGSFWGPSPWNYTGNVRSGFLQTNTSNGQASNKTIDTFISPDQPFMVLPPETCTQIAKQLPVDFDSKRDLYFWREDSSDYSTIVNGPHYLSFTFTDPGSTNANVQSSTDIEIKVPFKLLNLTLDTTIQQPDVPVRQYLPCYHYTRQDWVQWTLGRAFLQAAYFVGNWVPHAPNAQAAYAGGWSLAQAPGPNIKASDVQSLPPSGHSISPGYDASDLAATWGFAPASSESPTPPAPAPAAAGLSAGAKAGIAVGVIVGVLIVAGAGAYAVYRRRRVRGQQAAVSSHVTGYNTADEKVAFVPSETALLDSREVMAEMPLRRDEAHELPDSKPDVAPKDGPWTGRN